MTQTAFQGGSFNPIESGDVASTLAGTFTQQNRGWQRTGQMIQMNNAAKIRNAGKLWGQLEQFAPSVNKFLAHKHKDWAETQDAKGREWYHQNGVSEEEKEAYTQQLKDIGHSQIDANKMADEWELKGGDIWTSEKFRSLSPHRQVAAVRAHMAKVATTYDVANDPAVLNATDPTERVAAQTRYRQNFWKQFEGFDEKMVHLEVSPKIEAIEAASNKAWNATRTKEIKEQRLEDAYDLLRTDLEGDNPAEAVLFFAESQAGTFGGSIGQARRAAVDQIVSLTESGLIKRDVIEKLKTQEFDAKDGSKQKFGDYYAADFRKVKIARFNFLNQNEKMRKGTERMEQSGMIEELKEEMNGMDPNAINNAFFRGWQTKYNKEFGVDSDIIAKLQADNSIENVTYKADKVRLDNAVEMNRLRVSDLDNVGGKLRKEYLPIAQAMEKNHPIMGRHIQALENLPAHAKYVKTTLGGKKHQSVIDLGDALKSRYRQLSRELDIAGVENPNEAAYQQINDWFVEAAKDRKFRNVHGYDLNYLYNKLGEVSPLTDNQTAAVVDYKEKMRDLHESALDQEVLDGENNPTGATAFFTRAELKDMEKDYGTYKWNMDPKVRWLANEYNVHPLSIINRNREALNLGKLPENQGELALWNARTAAENRAVMNEKENAAGMRARWGTKTKDGKKYTYEIDEVVAGKEEDVKKGFEISGISEHDIQVGMFANRMNFDLHLKNNSFSQYEMSTVNQWRALTTFDFAERQSILNGPLLLNGIVLPKN